MTTADELLRGLNPNQVEAVVAKQQPLIIIAGAGSGKTRVLTRRIAHRILSGEAEARHTLAITFTKKAANELKVRLGALEIREKIEAQTFHAAALRILQRYWESQRSIPYELLDSKFRILAEVLSHLGTTTKELHGKNKVETRSSGGTAQKNKSLISALAGEIEWAKARGLTPSTYSSAATAMNRQPPLTPSETAAIFHGYEQRKSKLKKMDYDDLIEYATRALTSDPTFAATERYRVRHLYVDEFQDINPAQLTLMLTILGDRTDLCVVGDPNQAIYAWNGADPTLITSLPNRYLESKTVVLSHNYRSTPQILTLAKTALGSKKTETDTNNHLRSNLPDGPIPVIRSFDDEKAEAQAVARLARRAHQPGTKWEDIAVLARTNAQLVPVQAAFRELGIPVFISGESNYLAQSETRDLITRLERGVVSSNGVYLLAWLEETVDQISKNHMKDSAAQESLNLLLELSREFLSTSPGSDSKALALWLKTEAQSSAEINNGNAVTLTTFHKSKGLEWRSIFLIGIEDGLIPIARAESHAALEEERRLLYVAITRAKREITITWARRRNYNGRYLKREPSPYLDYLQETIHQLSGQITSSERAISAINGVRRNLQNSEVAKRNFTERQEALLANLRIWRGTKSTELGVPAHLIIHDQALEVIALEEPKTLEALSRIAGIGSIKASRFGKDLLTLTQN